MLSFIGALSLTLNTEELSYMIFTESPRPLKMLSQDNNPGSPFLWVCSVSFHTTTKFSWLPILRVFQTLLFIFFSLLFCHLSPNVPTFSVMQNHVGHLSTNIFHSFVSYNFLIKMRFEKIRPLHLWLMINNLGHTIKILYRFWVNPLSWCFICSLAVWATRALPMAFTSSQECQFSGAHWSVNHLHVHKVWAASIYTPKGLGPGVICLLLFISAVSDA